MSYCFLFISVLKKSLFCVKMPTNYFRTSGAVIYIYIYILSKDTLFFALADSPLIGVNPCDIHEGKLQSSPAHILLSCYKMNLIKPKTEVSLTVKHYKAQHMARKHNGGKSNYLCFDVYIKVRVLVSDEKKEYYPCILF